MRRHTSLLPLTHDHHHVLAQARRLVIASKATDEQARLASAEEFVKFFESEGDLHFTEEEDEILPLLAERGQGTELVARVVDEHRRLRALVEQLGDELRDGDVSQEILAQVADGFQNHVKLEEKQLFPLVQEVVSESELEQISLASRQRSR